MLLKLSLELRIESKAESMCLERTRVLIRYLLVACLHMPRPPTRDALRGPGTIR
jgi:hypothetical protein